MIIAREKKKSNIAEYILYMWQVEDMIRACKMNIDLVEKNIISQMKLEKILYEETKIWYEDLIVKMKQENVEKTGHISFVNDSLKGLEDYHIKLLNAVKDEKYADLFKLAQENIEALKQKGKYLNNRDIYTCLTGLYGLLVLRLKKQTVSGETAIAMQTISNLVAYLSNKYMQL